MDDCEAGVVEWQALDEQVMEALGGHEQLGIGGDDGLLARGEVLDQLDELGPEGFGDGVRDRRRSHLGGWE